MKIFFLLCAAYLHDIGMSPLENYLDDIEYEKFKNDNDKLKEYIRKNHHTRSDKFVNEHFAILDIEDPHAARFIGILCRCHRDIDIPEHWYTYKEDFAINIPFLAIWLRIADELDITYERLPIIDPNRFPIDEISRKFWDTHFSISGWGFDLDNPQLIKMTVFCKDQRIHRYIKSIETKINKQIGLLRKYVYYFRSHLKDIPYAIEIIIELEGYEPYDFKFTIQSYEILNYLISSLYSSPEYAIREVVKNAIDSCRLRTFKESDKYKPLIKVSYDEVKSILIIEDNGMGISKEIFENYFTKIGESYYSSESQHPEFYPLGELGIGVLSYFRIADKVEIDTRSEESRPIRIVIEDVFDYMFVSESKREKLGTRVQLYLTDNSKKELVNGKSEKSIHIFQAGIVFNMILTRYFSHVEIPIHFIFHDQKIKIHEEYDNISKNALYGVLGNRSVQSLCIRKFRQ